MNITYHPFSTPRRAEEYQGAKGNEVGGMALPPHVYEAIAKAKTSGKPCQYVVLGEHRRDDGTSWLHFGVTRAYIEAVTNYRDTGSGLHWTCPECLRVGGRHARGCSET